MSLYHTLKHLVVSTVSYITVTIACRHVSHYNSKRKNMWSEESIYFKRKVFVLRVWLRAEICGKMNMLAVVVDVCVC